MNTAEKVETIVDSHLASGTTSGTLGSLVRLDEGGYRVVADGLTVIVRSIAAGWSVRFKGFEGIDASLIDAARMALDAGKGRNVSTVEMALGV